MNKLAKLTIATLLISGFSSCGGSDSKTGNQEEEKIEKVEVQTLSKEKIQRVLEFSTTLKGYEQMNVSPSLTGNIEKIYVEVGSRVGKGQMLVRMNQNQLNTAKISLGTAQTELNRITALKESGSASQQTYDQTKSQYDQLKENVSFYESNTFVKAPFPGVISAKNYEDGEMYSGSPILTLTQINLLKAYVNIPETYFPYVKQGMTLTIKSEIYPNEVFQGSIETVFPTIDAATHTFQVKVKIPNGKEKLRPGMYANTSLELGESSAIVVPYSAVLKLVGSNERYVFANNNGVAKRISVKLGQRFDDKIEISGQEIVEGLELITVGQGRLVDGVKLEIVK